MLQHVKIDNGLPKYSNYLYQDLSSDSPDYFRINSFPDTLYVGKNSFKISGNLEYLVPKSLVYIDVIDSSGKAIYHEISDLKYDDNSTLVVIHIYQNIPPGDVTVYIGGRMRYNITTGQNIPWSTSPNSPQYIDIPNILWTKKVSLVLDKENKSKILFGSPPIIEARERIESYIINSSTSSIYDRYITITGSIDGNNTVVFNQTVAPYKVSNTSRFALNSKEQTIISADPNIVSDTQVRSNTITIPKYAELSRIQFNRLSLSDDFVGGNIIIRDLNSIAENIPDGLVIPDFSSSIVKVIDSSTAEIYPPLSSLVTELNGVKYSPIIRQNIINFTASYFSKESSAISSSTAIESFVELDITKLEPLVGSIDSIDVYYKSLTSYGDYVNVGRFKIREQNYLIDPTVVESKKDGVGDKEIGCLSYPEFGDYWNINANPMLFSGQSFFTASFSPPLTLDSGVTLNSLIKILYTGSYTTPEYYCYIRTNDNYLIQGHEGTEYKLEFTSRYTVSASNTAVDTDPAPHQIDIYISGTSVVSDVIHESHLKEINKNPALFGTYIGSVSTAKSNTQENAQFYFKSLETKRFTPIFVVRSGNSWEIKNIKVAPRNEFGYSPNHSKIAIPIETLKTRSELILKVDYLNGVGESADVGTTLYGLYFTGSGVTLPSGLITSSAQITSGSGILSSSGLLENGVLYYTSSILVANPAHLKYQIVGGVGILTVSGSVSSNALAIPGTSLSRILMGTTNQWTIQRSSAIQSYWIAPAANQGNNVSFTTPGSATEVVQLSFGYGTILLSSQLRDGSSRPIGPGLDFYHYKTTLAQGYNNWQLKYIQNTTSSTTDYDLSIVNNNHVTSSFGFSIRRQDSLPTFRHIPQTGYTALFGPSTASLTFDARNHFLQPAWEHRILSGSYGYSLIASSSSDFFEIKTSGSALAGFSAYPFSGAVIQYGSSANLQLTATTAAYPRILMSNNSNLWWTLYPSGTNGDIQLKHNLNTSRSFVITDVSESVGFRHSPETGHTYTKGHYQMLSGSGNIGYVIVDIDGQGTFGWRPISGSGGGGYSDTASYALTASFLDSLQAYFTIHTQSIAAVTWSFFHNSGLRYPVVTVYDSLSRVVVPEGIYAVNSNLLEIYFPDVQSGYATANLGALFGSSSYASNSDTASYVEWTNIHSKPEGIVSSSAQIETDISGAFQYKSIIYGGSALFLHHLSASHYIFTGSGTSVFNLPLISDSINKQFWIKHRGTGSINLITSGSDRMFDINLIPSMSMNTGESYILFNDGQVWNVF